MKTELSLYIHAAGRTFQPAVTRYISAQQQTIHINLSHEVALYLEPLQLIHFRDLLSAKIAEFKLEDAPAVPSVSNEAIAMARGHLGAAVTQGLPTDDRIIASHIGKALALLSPSPVEPPSGEALERYLNKAMIDAVFGS